MKKQKIKEPRTPVPQANRWETFRVFARKYRWRCFGGILLFEMLLVAMLPSDVLDRSVVLNLFVSGVQYAVSNIAIFDNPDFPRNGATRLYMTVVLFLVPMKIYLFYDWMADKSAGVFKHLVITPNTDTQPVHGADFIFDPHYQEKGVERPTEPRSKGSRKFWSVAIVLFALSTWMVLFIAFKPGDINRTNFMGRDIRALASGWWFGAWFVWSVKMTSFAALINASAVHVLQAYWPFFDKR